MRQRLADAPGEVYKITFPNGKAYIGITTKGTDRRFSDHVYAAGRGEKSALYNAIRLHGVEHVTVEVIGRADGWDVLCELERAAIVEHGSRSPAGYNMTDGGDGVLGNTWSKGWRPSAETRARMSASQKRRKVSEATRAKIGAAAKGNTYSAGRVHSEAERKLRAAALIQCATRAASGHKGVSWCRYTQRWRAHITVAGKMKCLGRYDDIAAAVAARQIAEKDVLERIAA